MNTLRLHPVYRITVFVPPARLDALGWSCTRLPLVHDIDEPADLVHLPPGW